MPLQQMRKKFHQRITVENAYRKEASNGRETCSCQIEKARWSNRAKNGENGEEGIAKGYTASLEGQSSGVD